MVSSDIATPSRTGMFKLIRDNHILSLQSCAFFMCFISMGANFGILGPTILDLTRMTKTEFTIVNYNLPARSGGFSLGSVFTGLLYHRINFPVAVISCFSISTLLTISVPFYTSVYPLIAAFFCNGFVLGFSSAGANIFLIQKWGKDNAPFLQALHFCYGFGAFIAPMIASPFLTDHPESVQLSNGTLHVQEEEVFNNLLYYPYTIIGIYSIVCLSFWTYLYRTYGLTDYRTKEAQQDEVEAQIDQQNGGSRQGIMVTVAIIGACIFMHIYYGLEITFGSYLTTFAVKSENHLPESVGAYMTSLYWFTFTFYRLVVIFLIRYIGNEKNILYNLVLILLSNVFLYPFAYNQEWALWVGTAIIGIGTSPIWASIFAFLNDYFPLSSRATSAIIVCANMGEFVFPTILSNFIENTPYIYLDVTLVCSVATAVLFLALLALLKRIRFLNNQAKGIGSSS